MKYISLFLTLLFLLFAAWQYNDNDAILWISVYLIGAYVHLRRYQGKINPEMLITLTVLFSAWSASSWFQMSSFEGFFSENEGLAMKTPNQELVREAAGLGILAVSFILQLFSRK